VSYEGVQHRLRFCFDQLTCVKMAEFQFQLQWRKQKKLGWVGEKSCFFFLKFPGDKGSVRRCVAVMQQPVLLLPSLRTFSRNRRKTSQYVYEELIIWPVWTNYLWTVPLMSKNDKHALDFALHLSRLFRCRWVWTFHVWLMLSSPNACLIIAWFSVALFPTFTQNLMLFLLLDPSWNRIRAHTRPKIKGIKKSANPTSCVEVCTLARKIC
jgi:hypothetical protein